MFDNVPEHVEGHEKALEAFQKVFFPVATGGWGPVGILFTSRLATLRGPTFLGEVTTIDVLRLPEADAVDFLLTGTIADDMAVHLVADSQAAAKELVSKENLDGLPLAIAAVRGQIIYMGVTVAEYLVEFKLRKVDGGVKMVSIALGSALDHAREDGAMAYVLAVTAYVGPDQITMELMGNDREAVQRICRLSLLWKDSGKRGTDCIRCTG